MVTGNDTRIRSTPRLSLAVITRDEERNLPRLLERARQFVDELVIVDSGSTDRTVSIAREFGARVIEADWPGFGRQKQRALEACSGDWILSLDADEFPDEELVSALARVTRGEGGRYGAYMIDRLTEYQGAFVRHAWSPDWVVRLVRRGAGRWDEKPVHEKMIVQGPIGRLPGHLLHYSYENLTDHYQRLVGYARSGAEHLDRKGYRFCATQLVARPLGAFLRRYLLKRGFRDGVRGLLVAGAAAMGVFMKYAFLFERQRRSRKPPAEPDRKRETENE